MNSFSGIPVRILPPHLADLATRLVYKVERNPIRKRRKGYRVVCRREPCALVVNPGAVGLMGREMVLLHPQHAGLIYGLGKATP